MPDESDVLFHEVQKFRQPWLWALILVAFGSQAAIFGGGMIAHLVFGKPWGKNPAEDKALIITTVVMIASGIAVCAFMWSLRLITVVLPNGLFIRFFPFHWSFKDVPLASLTHCEAERYRPIKEFGGWGIRMGIKRKAYNVRGNLGVRIRYANGRCLLIGSQRPQELAQAIKRILPGDEQAT